MSASSTPPTTPPPASDVVIQTGQGIRFVLRPASPLIRALALCIDLIVIGSIMTLIGGVIHAARPLNPDLVMAFLTFLYFAISIGYNMLLEWKMGGRTIGKRLLHLRVVDASGLKLHPAQIIIRNLLRIVDLLPVLYLTGGVACLLSSRRQRLGDLAAGTLVIHQPPRQRPDLGAIRWPSHNSLRTHPHLAAALRRQIQPEEASLGLEALARRNQLEPGARMRIFDELARLYAGKVRFPEEITGVLSPEQFVLDVIEILYEPHRNSSSTHQGCSNDKPPGSSQESVK